MNGTCQHEVLHEFDAEHTRASVKLYCDATIVGRDDREFNCHMQAAPETRTGGLSYCNENDIKDHIDNTSGLTK